MTRPEVLSLRAQDLFASVDDKFTGDDATRALAEKFSELSIDYANTPGDTVPISKQTLAEILWMLGQAQAERETLEVALFRFSEHDIPSFISLLESAEEIVAGHHDKHHDREILLAVLAKYLLTKSPSPSLQTKILDAAQKILGEFDEELAREEFTEERLAQLLDQAE